MPSIGQEVLSESAKGEEAVRTRAASPAQEKARQEEIDKTLKMLREIPS